MGLRLVAKQWSRLAWIEQQSLPLTYNCDVCGQEFDEDELTTTIDGEARLCNLCYGSEEYDNLVEAHPSGPFYHASPNRFQPGDRLTPLFERMSEEEMEYADFDSGDDYDGQWVFFTPDIDKAYQYALHGRGPWVYEVQPVGPIYHDANSPFDMADQYVAAEAVIVRKL